MQLFEVRELHRIEWFTRRVFKRLRELDLDVNALADRIGCKRPQVSRLLRSERVSMYQFKRLCAALDVDEHEWWMQPAGPAVKGMDLAQWERSIKAEATRIATEDERQRRR